MTIGNLLRSFSPFPNKNYWVNTDWEISFQYMGPSRHFKGSIIFYRHQQFNFLSTNLIEYFKTQWHTNVCCTLSCWCRENLRYSNVVLVLLVSLLSLSQSKVEFRNFPDPIWNLDLCFSCNTVDTWHYIQLQVLYKQVSWVDLTIVRNDQRNLTIKSHQQASTSVPEFSG